MDKLIAGIIIGIIISKIIDVLTDYVIEKLLTKKTNEKERRNVIKYLCSTHGRYSCSVCGREIKKGEQFYFVAGYPVCKECYHSDKPLV